MGRHLRTFTMAAAAAIGSIGVSTAAQADYFIRPYVALGSGAVVDGLDENGATQGSANFTSALQSQVDLSQGTVKTYLKITGPDAGGSGFGQAAGIFGDRVTFDGAEGTDVGFSFAFDGTIRSPARDPNLNSTLQIGVQALLRVFDPGAGATYENFQTLSGALVSETLFLDFSNPTVPLDVLVARTLADSLAVSGLTTFDVFASLSVFTSLNDNPATVKMDFLNTGRFGIQTAPGVTFISDSGVLLTDLPAGPVPEPATWAMMIAGFGLAGGMLRRERRTGRTARA